MFRSCGTKRSSERMVSLGWNDRGPVAAGEDVRPRTAAASNRGRREPQKLQRSRGATTGASCSSTQSKSSADGADAGRPMGDRVMKESGTTAKNTGSTTSCSILWRTFAKSLCSCGFTRRGSRADRGVSSSRPTPGHLDMDCRKVNMADPTEFMRKSASRCCQRLANSSIHGPFHRVAADRKGRQASRRGAKKGLRRALVFPQCNSILRARHDDLWRKPPSSAP